MGRTSDAAVTYAAGLDLGQPHEPTALAVVERAVEGDAAASFAVRHLERFPAGTPYAAVFDRTVELCKAPPLAGATLAVGQTGVGKPVVAELRRREGRPSLTLVTVTLGLSASLDGAGGWLVPKLDLIGRLQVLLQDKRLKVAEALPEAAVLVRELTDFRVKPPPVNTTDPLAAWRENAHDDLVFAVALAAWQAERQRSWDWYLGDAPDVPLRAPGAWGRLW